MINDLDVLVLSPTPTYPLDHGNRRRIYSVCAALRRRGARIHLLYYPSEREWQNTIPMEAFGEMSRQWDSFHFIAPTRPLHSAAEGEDHQIDEWWDHAIGDYVKWLFYCRRFDAFIVNYVYLSKAFDYAPPEVIRILDTHDRFTDRRRLLEEQGISREFFHTTKAEEAKGLERADLIWAIKPQEKEAFKEVTAKSIITVPHAEPLRIIPRQGEDEDDGYFVIGLLGALNNINVLNTW